MMPKRPKVMCIGVLELERFGLCQGSIRPEIRGPPYADSLVHERPSEGIGLPLGSLQAVLFIAFLFSSLGAQSIFSLLRGLGQIAHTFRSLESNLVPW